MRPSTPCTAAVRGGTLRAGRGTGRTGNRGGSGRRGRGTWWRRARDARRGSRLVLLLSRHLVEPRQELVAGHGADHPPFGDVPVGFPLHGLPFGGPEQIGRASCRARE